MIMELVISFSIAIIAIIIIVIINYYNEFQHNIIKIDKAETNIHDALIRKQQTFIRLIDFFKDNKVISDDIIDKFNNIKDTNNIKFNNDLDNINQDFKLILDDNEKLLKNDVLISINKELSDINIIINGCKKYYNNCIVKYNKLVKCFPSSLIAKILKYKEKNFYADNEEDSLKILDD